MTYLFAVISFFLLISLLNSESKLKQNQLRTINANIRNYGAAFVRYSVLRSVLIHKGLQDEYVRKLDDYFITRCPYIVTARLVTKVDSLIHNPLVAITRNLQNGGLANSNLSLLSEIVVKAYDEVINSQDSEDHIRELSRYSLTGISHDEHLRGFYNYLVIATTERALQLFDEHS